MNPRVWVVLYVVDGHAVVCFAHLDRNDADRYVALVRESTSEGVYEVAAYAPVETT